MISEQVRDEFDARINYRYGQLKLPFQGFRQGSNYPEKEK
jgi:hypothetical protein